MTRHESWICLMRSWTRRRAWMLVCVCLLLLGGCGGAERRELSGGYAATSASAQSATSGGSAVGTQGFAAVDSLFAEESEEALDVETLQPARMVAQSQAPAPPAATTEAAKAKMTAEQDKQEVTPASRQSDEQRGPLLVYEAWLSLGVFEVEDNQRKVIEAAESVGGFLQHQDASQVVVRVPAEHFKEALALIEAVGDVRNRRVQTHDVTEEFRDVQTRLDSARKVRQRLLELLNRAQNVKESLIIEHELERLLKEIERMEGRLKFLRDRVALSTISVGFSTIAEEIPADDEIPLPFPWLDRLGLRNLTEL